MSFLRANPTVVTADMLDLQRRLTDEMTNPSLDPASQPIIKAEPDTGPITRLFVIWDDWGHLSQQERSEVIMDAYKASMGQADALRIAVAMGVTTVEATQMGLT